MTSGRGSGAHEGFRTERGIVVAGIAIDHELPVGWQLGANAFADWTSGAVTREPLLLRHEIGSGAGLPLLIDAPDMIESYHVDAEGELAVRFGAWRPGEGDQWLRTERAGYEYALQYVDASECGTRQWRWQRTLFMYALASRGEGIIAHATGFVAPDGGGVLCPGASGVGKSTLALQIASEIGSEAILSDDRVALTVEGGHARICGTPWHSSGRFASPRDVALTTLVLPARSGGAPGSVRRLTAREALPPILRAVAAPFWSGRFMDFMLQTLDAVLRQVTILEFSYTPGPGAAEPLLRALSGGGITA